MGIADLPYALLFILILPFRFITLLWENYNKGNLFPPNFELGYTCGYAGGITSRGNGEYWLTLLTVLAVAGALLITKKPKSLKFKILLIYTSFYSWIVYMSLNFLGESAGAFCI
jgi:hypothetical protein